MCICTRFTCAAECVALPNKTKRPNTNRTVFLISSLLINLAHATISPPRVEQTNLRSRKTDTLRPAELDQECEMLDVSWVGIVRVESLKMRSEHDPGTERCGIHGHSSIRRRAELHGKAGRAAAVSGTTWLGTIQITTDARNRCSRPVASRLLTTVGQLQHRTPTFLLMRAHTYSRSQHGDC